MIPHRTKLRELVIEGWRQRFKDLKAELLVCLPVMIQSPS